jgi:tetratricopeptide (TPR) repeat protein
LADTQEVYLKAIELVGKATTPKEKRILASAYSLCHTEYTLYAIKAFEDYIESGLDIPNVSNIYKPGMSKEMLEREYVAGIFAQLGELYEKNYEFDKALKCYKNELKYDNWSHFPYIYLSELYRKMNEPDKSIKILEQAKTHPNYKGNEDLFYSDVVDRFLEEARQRKAKGYTFRKRGHKEFIPLDK